MKNIYRISGAILLILSISFTQSCKKEKPTPPVITTTAVTAVSYTTATSGGEVTNEGGDPVISRGICWGTTADPTIANSKTTENGGLGSFVSNITLLTPNTIYYVRAYATNIAGTGYGSQVSFTTNQVAVPVLTTTAITSITSSTAISGGNIADDKGGSVTAKGVCWDTATRPTIANSKTTDGIGTGNFVSNMTSLQPWTIYFVRSYATNSAGTSYGNEFSFKTEQAVPTLTTTDISFITCFTAKSGGNITNDGGGTVSSCGVCWSTNQNPTISNIRTYDGPMIGSFTSSIYSLAPNTIYYVRAYAINGAGTGYGNVITFTTPNNITNFNPNLTYGTLTDIDGNVYKTITIGTQTWMAENLKTTKLNDGISISLFTDNITWQGLFVPGYCWYNNNAATYKATYGALYNCLTVNTSKLCPTGWHMPSQAEWAVLTNYLGGENVAGNKLKESGTAHWDSPNTGATNETGFTALPGGYRMASFKDIALSGNWWSSTRISDYDYSYWGLVYLYGYVYGGYRPNTYGLSVRCVKD